MNTHHGGPISEKIALSKVPLNKHLREVLEMVLCQPGSTAAELAQVYKMPWKNRVIEIRRRLSDLKRDGLIYHDKTRICEVDGSSVSTYRVTEQGKIKLLNCAILFP